MLISKYSDKKNDSCFCAHFEGLSDRKKNIRVNSPLDSNIKKMKKSSNLFYEHSGERVTEITLPAKITAKKDKNITSNDVCRPVNDYSDTSSNSSHNSCNIYSKYQNEKDNCCVSSHPANILVRSSPASVPCDCCSGPQADCGYSSADNNIISSNGSGDSSVDSSEVACSEGFCNHDGKYPKCSSKVNSWKLY